MRNNFHDHGTHEIICVVNISNFMIHRVSKKSELHKYEKRGVILVDFEGILDAYFF